MQILSCLIPIFAVIGLGAFLRHQKFFDDRATTTFNRLAYFVALPAFLVERLSRSASPELAGQMVQAILVGTLATLACGWLLAWWLPFSRSQKGVIVQAAFRGNLAFIGLPLILFVLESFPESQAQLVEAAIYVSLPPVIIFYNIAAVTALSLYNTDAKQEFSWKSLLANLISNPILLACLTGWSVQVSGWAFPTAVQKTLSVMGAAAFPLALLGIGSQLVNLSVSGSWLAAILSSFLKCVLCPAAGWLAGFWIGMSGPELIATTILCGVPTAVSSYVLADQMKGDSDLAASTVLVSTLFSLISLSVILLILASGS